MHRMRDEVHYGDRVMRCYAERPAHVDALLRAAVRARPDAEALTEGETRITYAELDAAVGRIAGNLAAIGIGKGDRVALILGNRSEFVSATFAVARLGAISVPLNIRQRQPENDYVLRHSGAKAVIHEADLAAEIPDVASLPELAHRFAVGGSAAGSRPFADLQRPVAAPAPVDIAEEDTFSILYTSGTTGRPKGAMLTHLGTMHSCLHFVLGWGLGPEDVSILAVPASHVTGLVAVILPMVLAQGRTVIMPAFKARTYLELAAAERVTYTIIVPAMYNLCLLDPEFDRFDLSRWRVGAYGGAPMPEATIKTLAQKLPRMVLCNAYGATETTSPTTMMPLGQGIAHSDSVGKVVACGEVRIMDDEGREVAPGEPGEIWTAGPMVIPGYWNNPEANAANFVGGFWKSGDIGSKDADGYLKVFDRKKDMINRAGFKVYSAEVENVLSHHPEIVECAVIGRPDPVLGEKTHAFIVPKSGAVSEADIRAFCRTRMADYKIPDRITFLADALPRNANGKIQKPALREMIAAEA
ncbi:MAG TPA: AMP-binding protein [Candidatus Cybelea sp.]|nr:AMP-binding protein [Candidatus Cybelea sp.]